jgi:hypothetical protein
MKTARLAGALLLLVLSAGPASAQGDSWATMAPDPYAVAPTAPSVVEIGGKLYVHWFDQAACPERLSVRSELCGVGDRDEERTHRGETGVGFLV